MSDVCGILVQWLCMCFLQFDVVPIGAWGGQGRKSAWLSPFLLAVGCPIPFQEPVIRPFGFQLDAGQVHDPASGELQSLCRCLSGIRLTMGRRQ